MLERIKVWKNKNYGSFYCIVGCSTGRMWKCRINKCISYGNKWGDNGNAAGDGEGNTETVWERKSSWLFSIWWINQKIANGLNNKFTDDDYANLDVLFAIKANYSDYETYGYIKKDLDGDGNDELLLGSTINESGEIVIYDIFTIKDSKPKHVVSDSERARYYLCKDGMVAMEGSGGAAYSNWTYYEYKNGELKVKETVFTDDSIPGQTYYYSKDSEPAAASSDAISEADAKKIINKYTYEKIQYNAFK